MKRKSVIFRFEPQQWHLKVWEVDFWVRWEEWVWYYLSFWSVEWDNNYVCVSNPFKTIGDVELYILKTFRIDTSFSS